MNWVPAIMEKEKPDEPQASSSGRRIGNINTLKNDEEMQNMDGKLRKLQSQVQKLEGETEKMRHQIAALEGNIKRLLESRVTDHDVVNIC